MKPEIRNSSFINGRDHSRVAVTETNDCFVHALAIAFDVMYDEAHKIAESRFNRKQRSGTRLRQIVHGMEMMRTPDVAINERYCLKVNYETFNGGYTWPRKFAKKNKLGTFLIVTRSHALVIKDGVIYDNCNYCKDTAKILYSFEIVSSKK